MSDNEEIDILKDRGRFHQVEPQKRAAPKNEENVPNDDDLTELMETAREQQKATRTAEVRREILMASIGSFDLAFESDADFFKFLANSARWVETGEGPETGTPVEGSARPAEPLSPDPWEPGPDRT